MSEALPEALPACRPIRLRRILSTMSDAVERLNAALDGRYAIERELGEGGTATVYLPSREGGPVQLPVPHPSNPPFVDYETFRKDWY